MVEAAGSVTREEDTCEKVVMTCGSGEAWSPDRKLAYSGQCVWGEPEGSSVIEGHH